MTLTGLMLNQTQLLAAGMNTVLPVVPTIQVTIAFLFPKGEPISGIKNPLIKGTLKG